MPAQSGIILFALVFVFIILMTKQDFGAVKHKLKMNNLSMFLYKILLFVLYHSKTYRVVSCMRGKRRSVLKLSDIRTIWPEAGISDAVIDFFVR